MKNKLLLIALTALMAAGAGARPVDVATARKAATAFLQAAGAGQKVQLADITASTPFSEFYVFSLGQTGFILVAADDCVPPILGYSLTNVFSTKDMPAHVRGWFDGYERSIRQRKAGEVLPARGSLPTGFGQGEAGRQWAGLLSDIPPAPVLTTVSPLITTTWGQSPYYNSLCPYDDTYEERTVTGCVATATAQIMKYWNHPTTGYGSSNYEANNGRISYGTLSANYGTTTYNWTSMPNALSAASTTTQVDAVATLMYHIGVADEMTYDVSANGGSGAQNYNNAGLLGASSQTSLLKYFKYRADMACVYRADYNDATFCAILQDELDQNRPILFSGRDPNGGHSFVLDGYNSSGQFHVNWGWSGYCDGYYAIGALAPAAGGIGGNNGTYNENNVVLLGIQPNANFGSGGTVSTASTGGNASCSVSGGGTYSFGDELTITATAAEGYRFAGWSDNDPFNPRIIYGNGGNYSLTARFEPLSGDTLGYCFSDRRVGSLGAGSGTVSTWGIRLPASVLTPGRVMNAVQFYALGEGTYTVKVYTGASSPSTLAASTTYTVTEADSWQTVPLASEVQVDGSQNIWIALSTSAMAYPAAMGVCSGNEDGILWSDNMYSLLDEWQYSFMVRGLFSAPYVEPSCDPITAFPYTMGFESNEDLSCWMVFDADGDGVNWGIYPNDSLTNVAYSLSWGTDSDGNGVVLYPDNWLFMPAMALPEGNSITMTWEDGATDPSYYAEHYGVYISSTSTSTTPADYTQLWETTLSTPLRTTRTLDLSAYAGQTVRLAFRHFNSSDVFMFYLDNIAVAATEPTPEPVPPTISVSGPATLTEGETGTFTATAATGATIAWTLQGATPATATGSTASASWAMPGNYNVVATTTLDGLQSSDTLRLTVTAIPQYTVTTRVNDPAMGSVEGGGTYRSGTEVRLAAHSNSGFHFVQWHDGLTDSVRTITVTADITVTANFAQNVGIAQADSQPITLCPNPASTTTTLAGVQGSMVQVYDMSGRLVERHEAQDATLTLDLNPYARGTYFVHIIIGDTAAVRKLVVR